MRIAKIRSYRIDHRLAEASSIAYRTMSCARNVLVIIETIEGLVGIGESSPLKPVTCDTREEALQFIRYARVYLKDSDPCDIPKMHSVLDRVPNKVGFTSQTAKAAIDSACYDLLGKMVKKPVYQIIGCKRPRRVPNTVTIYLRSLEDTARKAKYLMKRYRRNALQRLKLKLSGNPRLDKAKVLTVSEIFPGELTLDANQAYRDEDSAIEVFNDIYDALGSRVVLVEQPSPKGDLRTLKHITHRCKIPVFADESVVTLKDLEEVIRREAVDGVNIKLQKAGGIFWGAKLAELARDSGLEIMVGCMMEGGIGIAQDAHFLAGISGYAVASDLDTDLEIRNDIITSRSRVPFNGGARIPTAKPGLGVELRRRLSLVE